MSKKITTFKGLRKRLDKQVNAYFTVKGKVTKVTCNVEKFFSDSNEVRLRPINADELAKLKTVGGEGWHSFVVNKAWPHTKMDHCHYLSYCGPAGYTFKHRCRTADAGLKHKSKKEPAKETIKVREDVCKDIYQGFRVGIEQTDKVEVYEGCAKTPRTTIEGRWKLIEDTGDIYLLSNDPSLDGSVPHSKTTKEPGYQYSWWMGPADGSDSYYKLSVVNAVAEPEEISVDVGAAVQKDPLERIADALDRIAAALDR